MVDASPYEVTWASQDDDWAHPGKSKHTLTVTPKCESAACAWKLSFKTKASSLITILKAGEPPWADDGYVSTDPDVNKSWKNQDELGRIGLVISHEMKHVSDMQACYPGIVGDLASREGMYSSKSACDTAGNDGVAKANETWQACIQASAKRWDSE